MSARSLIVSLLLACCAMWPPQILFAAAGPTVTRGPYLQMGTPTSVVVRWRTSAQSNSSVCYGIDLHNLSSCVDLETTTIEHSVTVSGLTPDTGYYYSIGTTTQVLAGGDPNHFFITSPVPGTSRPTRIWVIGDSGTADANAAAVRDAYFTFTEGLYTALWLMLGDNADPLGADEDYQAAVFNMYPTLLRQTVLWPTLGNHEAYSADSSTQTGPYFDMFTLPTQGEAGGLASGTEAYYSFDYGNIHFVVLDSYETSASPSGLMMTWLQNDLASNTHPWVVAYWHHPPYSKGGHDSDTSNHLKKMREKALPILEAHGVDLVLSGHSHSYERSFLIDGHYGTSDTFTESMKKNGGDGRVDGTGAYENASTPNQGAVYAVAGSSGKTSGGPLNHPVMFISLSILGSMVLDVNGDRLDAVFLDSKGVTRDHFTIVKDTGSPTSPTVTVSASDPTATEAGPTTGSFTVSRSGSTALPLTVGYTIGGTATNGSDYQSLPVSVTIPPGSSTVTIVVTPIDDSLGEGNETVVATLAAGAAYMIGAPGSATVTISDNDPTNQPPSVNTGPDQTLTFPGSASLNATVDDDGLPNPPGMLTLTWTKVSGPGTVTFDNASSPHTTASFSQRGAYVLRLTANDGAFFPSDDIKITVNPTTDPDLIIASLSIAPKKIKAGATISVSDTVKNVGTGPTGTSTIGFFLSTNKFFDAADVFLGSRAVPSLAAAGKNSGATSIPIPSGTAPGNYYVLGVADSGGVAVEKKEDNNTEFKPITVN